MGGLFSKMKILLVVKAARSPGAVFTVISYTRGQRWVPIRNHHRGFYELSEHIAYVDRNGDQPMTDQTEDECR